MDPITALGHVTKILVISMLNQIHSISLLILPQCKSWLHEQVDKKKKQQKLLLRPLESNTCDVMSFDIFSVKAILWIF